MKRNPKLKDIKEVDGWKVNHPHSGANVVFAIFTMLFAAFPLVVLFLPTFSVDFKSLFKGANGLDFFKVTLNYLRHISDVIAKKPITTSTLITADVNPLVATALLAETETMQQVAMYVYIAMGAIIILMLFFSLIIFLVGLTHLLKGYLKHAGAIKGLTATQFIFSLLYAACALFFYFTLRTNSLELFVWFAFAGAAVSFVFLLIFSIYHRIAFEDHVLEKDLVIQTVASKPVENSTNENVNNATQIADINSDEIDNDTSVLPKGITSIGGHAFSENQNLIIANIPIEVTKLGPGAFSNCLNLQVVSIPVTVTEIGYNCFFNCIELERINYSGTKLEWKKVKRGSNWLTKAKTNEVVCSDGIVIVNPYH